MQSYFQSLLKYGVSKPGILNTVLLILEILNYYSDYWIVISGFMIMVTEMQPQFKALLSTILKNNNNKKEITE